MHINNFKYMLALEEAGSINKAAKSLYISQQGLSRVIDSMESELSAKLIERSHAGIQFTETGHIFLQHAHSIIDEYITMQQRMKSIEQAETSESPLDIVISPYASLVLFSTIFPRISSREPLVVSEWPNQQIDEALCDGGHGKLYLFDWVSNRPSNYGWSSLSGEKQNRVCIEPLFNSKLGLMCKRNSSLARKPIITMEELTQVPLVCYSGKDYLQSMDRVFGVKSLSNVALKVSNTTTILSFLRNNEDAGMILDELTYAGRSEYISDFVFVPFDTQALLSVGFGYCKDDPLTARYKLYISIFKELLQLENLFHA